MFSVSLGISVRIITVVASQPVKDYPADFVSGCLVAAWPQVLEMICTNRDVPF